MTTNEMWRPVVGYEGRYEVSNMGRVRSLLDRQVKVRATPLILKAPTGSNGYPTVNLSAGRSKQRVHLVHQLVLEAFVGPRPEGLLALHKDDVGTNNVLTNLYWGTRRQNMDDMHNNGRPCNMCGCPTPGKH